MQTTMKAEFRKGVSPFDLIKKVSAVFDEFVGPGKKYDDLPSITILVTDSLDAAITAVNLEVNFIILLTETVETVPSEVMVVRPSMINEDLSYFLKEHAA